MERHSSSSQNRNFQIPAKDMTLLLSVVIGYNMLRSSTLDRTDHNTFDKVFLNKWI